MRSHFPKDVPDYTTAVLVMAGVNLTWMFYLLWSFVGLLPVMALAYYLDRWIMQSAVLPQLPHWLARDRR